MAKKRPAHENNENNMDTSNTNNNSNYEEKIEKLENELNFYKEKLIMLARAHATLLTLVGAKPGESYHGRNKDDEDDDNKEKDGDRKGGKKGKVREKEEEEEEGEDMLVSHSQLSTLSDEEEEEENDEADIEDEDEGAGVGESQETHMTLSTIGSATVLLNDDAIGGNNNEATTQQQQQTETSTPNKQQQQGNSNNLLLPPLLPFDRWNSIASQRSAFSDFIIESGDVLNSLPEMEEWLVDLTTTANGGGPPESSAQESAFSSVGVAGAGQTQNGGGGEETERQNSGLLPKSFVDGDNYDNQKITTTTTITSTPSIKQPVHVRVGVGVLVKDPLSPHKVFAGIRIGSHGSNTLALPGGHLELQESWSQCATREVLEETGLHITNLTFGHVTNDMMPSENKHYITIFMMATCIQKDVRPQNLEPHKCEGWYSYGWDELREMIQVDEKDGSQSREKRRKKEEAKLPKLFGPLRHLVEDSPSTVLDFLKS